MHELSQTPPQDQEVGPTEVAPAAPPGTFYRVDSSRATFRELWRDVRSPAVLIVWLTKLLRVKLPGSVNDPNVESLRPFVVDQTQIPAEAMARIELTLRELREVGFEASTYLAIVDLFHQSRTYFALLTHRDGQACGRIALRTEGTPQKPKVHFFTEFFPGSRRARSSARRRRGRRGCRRRARGSTGTTRPRRDSSGRRTSRSWRAGRGRASRSFPFGTNSRCWTSSSGITRPSATSTWAARCSRRCGSRT